MARAADEGTLPTPSEEQRRRCASCAVKAIREDRIRIRIMWAVWNWALQALASVGSHEARYPCFAMHFSNPGTHEIARGIIPEIIMKLHSVMISQRCKCPKKHTVGVH